ncbi:MAG TPA: class I SAM-dependent methyltransferase [Mycobacteriales bacterium]|nr:class I SAM-dependent methyltransferase [Mycobacteriales bacterium]
MNDLPDVGRPWRADLRRSATLFRAFLHEQDDPDRFYRTLAADSVAQLAGWQELVGQLVVDVGGGPGYFRDEFSRRGASYVVVDPDLDELWIRGRPGPNCVRGDGTALPLRTGSVGVCFSSNALEHVAEPERLADEMLRVTRPGGLVYLAYTNWLSPNGGHETKPWHLLIGGRRAADRYARRRGQRPKNDFGRTLFPISATRMLRWADRAVSDGRATPVARGPRYHPSWAQRLIDVPGLRELTSWNILIVLRRT